MIDKFTTRVCCCSFKMIDLISILLGLIKSVLGIYDPENPFSPPTTPFDSVAFMQEWNAWFNGLPKQEYLRVHPSIPRVRADGTLDESPVLPWHDALWGMHGGPAKGSNSSSSEDTFPIVLQIFGALGGLALLIVLLVCCRQRVRGQENARVVRPDLQQREDYEFIAHEEIEDPNVEPAWISVPPTTVSVRDDEGWNRENIGQYVTVLSSRTLNVACQYNGQSGVDGAMWSTGFTNGRHIFAIMWPRDQRVYYGAAVLIGVGTPFEMHSEYGHTLVGGNRQSVGFNLISRSTWYNGYKVDKYPNGRSRDFIIPTLFYMYLDLEENKLSFGSEDGTFWGVAASLKALRKGDNGQDQEEGYPLYPMVAFRKVEGKFMMFYKGKVPEDKIPQPQRPVSPPEIFATAQSGSFPSYVNYGLSVIPEETEMLFTSHSQGRPNPSAPPDPGYSNEGFQIRL